MLLKVGRPKLKIDMKRVNKLRSRGFTILQISKHLNCSTQAIKTRLKEQRLKEQRLKEQRLKEQRENDKYNKF